MKRCDICKEGIAEHLIEDTRDDMKKIEFKPGEWIGDMMVCDNCMNKIKVKNGI